MEAEFLNLALVTMVKVDVQLRTKSLCVPLFVDEAETKHAVT